MPAPKRRGATRGTAPAAAVGVFALALESPWSLAGRAHVVHESRTKRLAEKAEHAAEEGDFATAVADDTGTLVTLVATLVVALEVGSSALGAWSARLPWHSAQVSRRHACARKAEHVVVAATFTGAGAAGLAAGMAVGGLIGCAWTGAAVTTGTGTDAGTGVGRAGLSTGLAGVATAVTETAAAEVGVAPLAPLALVACALSAMWQSRHTFRLNA